MASEPADHGEQAGGRIGGAPSGSAARALARLRDPSHPALAAGVHLALDALLDEPLAVWLDDDAVRPHLPAVLDALARDLDLAPLHAHLRDAGRRALNGDTTLREALPHGTDGPLRDLAMVPWVPDEDLVFRLLNHAATRQLARDVLTGALHRFVDRLRHADQGLTGGLAGRAVKRGRGFLGGGLGGALGGAAEGLVDNLRKELTKAFEGRVGEFAGQAAEDTVRAVAAWVADPDHAEPLAAMRGSLVDLLLDEPLAARVEEAGRADAAPWAARLRALARALRDAPDRDARLDDLLDRLRRGLGDLSTRRLLDALGLHAVVLEIGRDALAPPARRVVASEAFGAWWDALHAPDADVPG